MRRRTYRQIRSNSAAEHHHHVYVVLLSPEAARVPGVRRANPKANPALPCLYVGMTGLSPEERFANHKEGIKAARVVQRFGVKLLPEFYECYNPMPYQAAIQLEMDLAEDLRSHGYTVAGGH